MEMMTGWERWKETDLLLLWKFLSYFWKKYKFWLNLLFWFIQHICLIFGILNKVSGSILSCWSMRTHLYNKDKKIPASYLYLSCIIRKKRTMITFHRRCRRNTEQESTGFILYLTLFYTHGLGIVFCFTSDDPSTIQVSPWLFNIGMII